MANPHPGRPMQSVEWSELDADWKAGIKTPTIMLREYADRHDGYSPSLKTILWHYQMAGIPRDLTGQIMAVGQAKAKEEGGEVLTAEEEALLRSRHMDEDIITVNAAAVAGTLIGHRKAVRRYQVLALNLLSELEEQTINRADMVALGEMMRSENERGVDKLNDIYQRVIGTPGRVDAIKKLAETTKILINLERQALGIADNANGDANSLTDDGDMPPEELAKRVAFMLMQAQANEPAPMRVISDDADCEIAVKEGGGVSSDPPFSTFRAEDWA